MLDSWKGEIEARARSATAVMERLGVDRAIAFDDDFAVYCYGARRERAFEILR